MKILGISALYHDAAAAVVLDGEIIAAAQEERFSRIKNDPQFPFRAIEFCLNEVAKISSAPLDYIVIHDQPLLMLDRYMQNILQLGADAHDLIEFGYDKMFAARLQIHYSIKHHPKKFISDATKIIAVKHHLSHAAAAFFPSPFERSAILTLDGVGEWTTLSMGIGEDNRIELKEQLRYPHSLGLFYSAFTYFCGFKVNSGEYKFMGLAPYGRPIYVEKLKRNLIDLKADGSFRLNLDYFDYQNGRTMIKEEAFSRLFNGGRRLPESTITRREADIAASVQTLTEEIILRLARHIKNTFARDCDNLTMAGGVALNCVANGKLQRERIFKRLWIQPAAGDAGGALGAALYMYHCILKQKRTVDGLHDRQRGSYLGPAFDDADIENFLVANGYKFHSVEDMPAHIAELLCEQKVVALFQGRMEFGPRALGARSILADPRSDNMQTRLNLKTKFRESFRPFAPAVLRERAADYFEIDVDSPYMLLCADVRLDRRVAFSTNDFIDGDTFDMLPLIKTHRSDIPAVTHVDYSARVQTVDGVENPFFRKILSEFERRTGCAMLINTSFNVRGEPIVCTPEDACRCFMRTDIDALAIGNFILHKEEQF